MRFFVECCFGLCLVLSCLVRRFFVVFIYCCCFGVLVLASFLFLCVVVLVCCGLLCFVLFCSVPLSIVFWYLLYVCVCGGLVFDKSYF